MSNNFVETIGDITRSTANIQLSQAKGSRVATDEVGNVCAAERFVSASKKKKI